MSSWWIRANQRHSISWVTASSRLCNSAGVRVFLTARMKPSASARHDSILRCLPNGIVPILPPVDAGQQACLSRRRLRASTDTQDNRRSEEHTSELQSLMLISYAVFCLNKKQTKPNIKSHTYTINN